jgi:cytochrome b561
MKPAAPQFSLALRLVHWLMAVMVIAMLFIGIGMVSTVSEMRTWLIDVHKPLGILILCLVAVRVCLRLLRPTTCRSGRRRRPMHRTSCSTP